jgi:hypothetical protein
MKNRPNPWLSARERERERAKTPSPPSKCAERDRRRVKEGAERAVGAQNNLGSAARCKLDAKVAEQTLTCPFLVASCSGVSSSKPRALTFAPARMSHSAISKCPWLLASCSGVHPARHTKTHTQSIDANQMKYILSAHAIHVVH